jgi:hypothetical protein
VDAVDLPPLTAVPADTAIGSDADAWFMALDGLVVRVGRDACVLRVEGIHGDGSTLWIQVSLFDEPTPGVVLQVEAGQKPDDVVDTLKAYELTGIPLEVIKVPGRCATVVADAL